MGTGIRVTAKMRRYLKANFSEEELVDSVIEMARSESPTIRAKGMDIIFKMLERPERKRKVSQQVRLNLKSVLSGQDETKSDDRPQVRPRRKKV